MAEVTEINHVESTATRFALNTHEVANLPVCVCVCVAVSGSHFGQMLCVKGRSQCTVTAHRFYFP